MSRSSYTTYHIETEFGHLAVHYQGNVESDRAFVFVHGHIDSSMENDSHNIFNQNDNELKILLDLRSHGSSIRTQIYPSMSDKCEDIDIFIEKIRSKFTNVKKFHFIGWSQGASTMLFYLLNNYKGKKFLGNTFLFAPRLNLKGYLTWFEKEMNMLLETQNDVFDKRYSSKGVLKIHKKFIDEFSDIDFYSQIANLKINTFLIRGTFDYLLQREEAVKLINLNRRYLKYIEIDGLEHTPKPNQFEMLFDVIVELAESRSLIALTSNPERMVTKDSLMRNSVFVQSSAISAFA